MFFMAEYASMITVSCLATILFFGGWLSPFPQTGAFAWTHYLPAAASAAAGFALVIHGLRYGTIPGRIVLPALGFLLCGLAGLLLRPGIQELAQGPFWFLLKVAIFLFIYVWTRGTLPRLRYDQLMAIGWKLLLPLAILNVVITSLAILWTGR
jgi:NADH-quinone oxidoreductase subunit H